VFTYEFRCTIITPLKQTTRDKIMDFKDIEIMLINKIKSLNLFGATLTNEEGMYEALLVADNRYSFTLNGKSVCQLRIEGYFDE
jgi:hypothetical protein